MEIYNPNPTIFVPTRLSKASHHAKAHSLWLDDDDSDRERAAEDDSDAIEAIDQDEIFGASGRSSTLFSILNHLLKN